MYRAKQNWPSHFGVRSEVLWIFWFNFFFNNGELIQRFIHVDSVLKKRNWERKLPSPLIQRYILILSLRSFALNNSITFHFYKNLCLGYSDIGLLTQIRWLQLNSCKTWEHDKIQIISPKQMITHSPVKNIKQNSNINVDFLIKNFFY